MTDLDAIRRLREALDACPHGPQYVAADFTEDGVTWAKRSADYFAAACQAAPILLRLLDARTAALRYAEEQTRRALGWEQVNAKLRAVLGDDKP